MVENNSKKGENDNEDPNKTDYNVTGPRDHKTVLHLISQIQIDDKLITFLCKMSNVQGNCIIEHIYNMYTPMPFHILIQN